MKSFLDYLREAYPIPARGGNWNVQPNAIARSMGMTTTHREVTYHKDIGLPKSFDMPAAGMRLRYGFHAKERAEEKGLDLPNQLPTNFELIEVTMEKYRVIKWVVRFALTRDWDIVLVLLPDGFVKTAWPNASNDLHRTLDKSKYARPTF